MRVAWTVTNDLKVKKADQVMAVVDTTEPEDPPQLRTQVVEAKRKVRKARHPICTLNDVDSQNF